LDSLGILTYIAGLDGVLVTGSVNYMAKKPFLFTVWVARLGSVAIRAGAPQTPDLTDR
jgi:hypothetical protein